MRATGQILLNIINKSGDVVNSMVDAAPSEGSMFIIDTEKHVTALLLLIENSSSRIPEDGTKIISPPCTVGK